MKINNFPKDVEDGFRLGIGWERRRRSLRETAMNYKRAKNFGKYTLALKKYNRHLKYIEVSDAWANSWEIKNYRKSGLTRFGKTGKKAFFIQNGESVCKKHYKQLLKEFK